MSNFFKFLIALIPGTLFYSKIGDIEVILESKGFHFKSLSPIFYTEIAVGNGQILDITFESTYAFNVDNVRNMTYIGRL